MIPVEIIEENAVRNARLDHNPDPIIGDADDPLRAPYQFDGTVYYLPSDMLSDPKLAIVGNAHDFAVLRFKYDFPFWAATCVVITDKYTSRDVPFHLNRPQRRLLGLIEAERRAGRPIRLILLKARQWGGSTLIQIYFAWIQIIHRRNWNSLICAHVKDTAATIRGMYAKLLSHYPREYWDEETRPEFKPFEGLTNTRFIPGRECRVTICSSENQEATRGQNYALAHLSEVAFWKDSLLHSPVNLMRSTISGIASEPLSVIAMESTANGAGNFFHNEWLRANKPGASDKIPFFVPWHEIDRNRTKVSDPHALWDSLDEYERELWHRHGCTLEAIKWYHDKRLSFPDHASMMAEYPGTPAEAFAGTDHSVFSAADVEALRSEGCDCEAERGEVTLSSRGDVAVMDRPRFLPASDGKCEIWSHPRAGGDYMVCVDIGGRSRDSDYSVIAVLDRHTDSGADAVPEIVAQWRGHIDHNLLARKAEALGRYYADALLIVESNSWESSSEGEGRYLLDTLSAGYPNLYYRPAEPGAVPNPGFHTNVRTKPAVIANLVAFVRERGYIERSSSACDELLQYESHPDGSYAASRGCHDDILMTRAIALYVHATTQPATPFRFTDSTLHAILDHCTR
ncbi:MAG: hypothetical protein NC411_09460 [Bacteroides sp.]|nr:hypothetical protein [Bacteroides sp.]